MRCVAIEVNQFPEQFVILYSYLDTNRKEACLIRLI